MNGNPLCECGHGADACAHSGCRNYSLLRLPRRAVDERTVAERRWMAPLLAPKPQKSCDHGLFSDEAAQLDLIEMFQDPTNEE